jgi:hypothetical protein
MGAIGTERKIYEIPEPARVPDTVPAEVPQHAEEPVPV